MRNWALLIPVLTVSYALAQTQQTSSQPVIVSAQMQQSGIVYRVNGRKVEDSSKNSLLTNLGKIAEARGLDVPVFVIIDERASFSEVGKLETALDKIGLTSRHLFVGDFRDGTMNEVRWDQNAVPIPTTTGQ